MKDPIQHAIEHFPEHEETIRRLGESNANFNATCHAFGAARSELHKLEGSAEADAEARTEQARRRCADLADELLSMMQQNIRV